ncbi:MAG: hypothetical protein RL186_910 [Pseudomonadota bacterium]|jgi:hypothetical protein
MTKVFGFLRFLLWLYGIFVGFWMAGSAGQLAEQIWLWPKIGAWLVAGATLLVPPLWLVLGSWGLVAVDHWSLWQALVFAASPGLLAIVLIGLSGLFKQPID